MLTLVALGGLAGARAATGGPATTEDLVAMLRPVTLMVETDQRWGHRVYGSGFLVSSDGLVATCDHVVRDAQEVACYYRNAERVRAKVLFEDEDLDLAVVQLEGGKTYPTVTLGDSDLDLVEGAAVGVIGYPEPFSFFRLGVGLDTTETVGTVSAIRLGDRPENRTRNSVVQIEAGARPGNSGGPVFRLQDGKVIGVLALGLMSNPPMPFAIPINQLKTLLASKSMSLKPAPLKADAPETTLEPGRAETLVTIRDDKEMADIFVNPMDYQRTARNETGVVIREMLPAFGFNPAAHPRPAVEGPDLYVGGLNGYMHKIRHRRLTTDEVWLPNGIELDYPITMPAALDKNNVTVCAGTLNLSWQAGQLNMGERMGAATVSALTFGIGGLFKWKKRIERHLNTDGRVYVLDKGNGRLKSQIDTAFPNAPVVKDGTAYVPAMGQLMAIDTTTGTVKWKVGDPDKPLEGRTWYTAALGSDGKLYTYEVPVRVNVREFKAGGAGAMPTLPTHFYLEAGVGKSHDDPSGKGMALLRCRNAGDGKVEWEAPLFDATTYLRPLATALMLSDDAKLGYCQLGPLVVAVDLSAHKVAWPARKDVDAALQAMKKVCWDREKELEPANATQEQVMRAHEQAAFTSNTSNGMALANGRLYYGSYDVASEGNDKAFVRVLKADTGEEVKRLDCAGRPTAPLVADGVVYFGASHTADMKHGRGEPFSWLRAVSESTLEESWRLRVDNRGLSYAPQVSGRNIYFADEALLYELPLPLN